MRTLSDFDFKGKKVLVRSDFNVPLSSTEPRKSGVKLKMKTKFSSPKGAILDDFRIKKSLPTISYLKERKAKVILISHLGRFQERPENREKYSLKPIASKLEELLGVEVKFLSDCIGKEVKNEIDKMREGEIVLLENLRFHKEEENNEPEFAQKLASLGDIFINDAFSVCHRAHASISAIPRYLTSGAGLLLEKEIKILEDLIQKPEKPLIAIIGGLKVETKIGALNRISEVADFILIGWMMKEGIEKKDLKLENPQKVIKPVDVIGTFDIGPKTIFWSGPLGMIEKEKYQKGSKAIAQAIIESGAFSLVGGGETAEFINKAGLASKFNHLSTGGGAMLEFLSGKKLPGILALEKII
jgi:phosphoglycerate kinase